MWLDVIVKCCEPCGSKPFQMMIRHLRWDNHQVQGSNGTSQAPKPCMQIASRSTWMVLKWGGQQKHGHFRATNWAVQNLVSQILEKLSTYLVVILFFWVYVFLSHAFLIEMVGAEDYFAEDVHRPAAPVFHTWHRPSAGNRHLTNVRETQILGTKQSQGSQCQGGCHTKILIKRTIYNLSDQCIQIPLIFSWVNLLLQRAYLKFKTQRIGP